MENMKKYLTVSVVSSIVLVFSSCGGGKNESQSEVKFETMTVGTDRIDIVEKYSA